MKKRIFIGSDPAVANSTCMYSTDELGIITDLQAPLPPTQSEYTKQVMEMAKRIPPQPKMLQNLEQNISPEARRRIERLKNRSNIPQTRP